MSWHFLKYYITNIITTPFIDIKARFDSYFKIPFLNSFEPMKGNKINLLIYYLWCVLDNPSSLYPVLISISSNN